MWYKKSFDLSVKYENIGELQKALEHITNCYSNYDKYDRPRDMSYDDLDNVIYRAEKTALTLRNAMEFKEKNDYYFDENHEKNFNENNPVSVDFDGKILKISTPLTFKRMYRDSSLKENYILMNYVKAALAEWQNETQINLFQCLKLPLDVYIVRYSNTWNRIQFCDHDNLENGRIINEIFYALGYQDSARNMDLHHLYRQKDDGDYEKGTLFIVKERDGKLLEI